MLVKLPDVSLWVETHGTGEAVVFANSLAANVGMWGAQVQPLVDAGFRVVCIDTRGHGHSSVPVGPYTLEALAGDLIGVVEHLGIDRFALVGCSLGGMVAQRVAIDHADRIDALVLTATASQIGTPRLWDERVARVRRDGLAGLADQTMSRWFTPAGVKAQPANVRSIHRGVVDTPVDGFCRAALAMRDVDLAAELGNVRAPTLVTSGTQDPGTPVEDGRRIAERIPGARFVAFDAAHFLHLERRDAFNAALLNHLSRRRK